ncbi:DUF2971 domain-containing protein [Mycobacterium marinum]|uniref:DUF2971 domain-containing protein n=1 Tax=Mycobacterium marinum TaxID=1781 RepID=UPI000B96DEBD|nr:DUF2971 domain-containing protein [Mycobacterium marinum]
MSAPLVDEPDLPPHLYHYTNSGGLLGILEQHKLWATHAAYLNDAQETIYGLNNVIREVDEMGKRFKIPDELNDDDLWSPVKQGSVVVRWIVTKVMLTLIKKLAQDRVALLQQNAGPFVSCLSGERDQLSQWRGYSGDGGYAICFDAETFHASIKQNQPGTQLKFDHPSLGPMELGARYLIKMRYSTDPQFIRSGLIAFFRSILKHMATKADGDPNFDQEIFKEVGQQIIRDRMGWILGIAIQTKNPGFVEEQEYRVVTFANPEMFHATDIGLVPRINIEFDPSCVKEIIVGPGGSLELRRSSIEYFRNTHAEYSHVEVKVSDTPFRGT